jgi:hypothetical protein
MAEQQCFRDPQMASFEPNSRSSAWSPATSQVPEPLLGYFAVRLPSQGGCNTDTNRDEIAGEASSRASLFHLVFDCQETIISCLSFRSPVVEAMKDPQKNFIKLHGLPLIACTFAIFEKGTRPFVRHFRHDYPPLDFARPSCAALRRFVGDFSA